MKYHGLDDRALCVGGPLDGKLLEPGYCPPHLHAIEPPQRRLIDAVGGEPVAFSALGFKEIHYRCHTFRCDETQWVLYVDTRMKLEDAVEKIFWKYAKHPQVPA